MNEDERFVREHWKGVALWDRGEDVDPSLRYEVEVELVHHPGSFVYFHCESHNDAWSTARRFTEERLWQIRQVEEEIGYLSCRANFMVGEGWENHIAAIMTRILAREQAALDSLRRGMKQPAAQTATGKPAPMGEVER